MQKINLKIALPVVGAGMILSVSNSKAQIPEAENVYDENQCNIMHANNIDKPLDILPECVGTQGCKGIAKTCGCNLKMSKNKGSCMGGGGGCM